MGAMLHEDRYGVLTQSLTPAGTAAGPLTASQTFTVQGLKTTDQILHVSPPSTTASLAIVGHRVSAANTLQLTFGNFSTGPLTSASGTYTITVFRAENIRDSVSSALDA